jgi:aminopeptidase N
MGQFRDHLRFMEETFGPYPFRADKYGVVQTPYLGMEHQTAIAYGSTFSDNAFGYDWLHLHELAHEWWGNLATAADWRDFWLHEGTAIYTEALYLEKIGGPERYRAYLASKRPLIKNAAPVIPAGATTTGEAYFARTDATDSDVYYKGGWVLHALRGAARAHVGEDAEGDRRFLLALRRFLYPTEAAEASTDGSACHFVSTEDFADAYEQHVGLDPRPFLDRYLRRADLPRLTTERTADGLALRWENEPAFDLPVEVEVAGARRWVSMTGGTGRVDVSPGAAVTVDPDGWLLRAEG